MTALPASTPSAESHGTVAAGEFRAPVVRGLLWQLFGRGTWQLSQMVVVVLLARLLTPREYGVAGMVLVIISFEPLLAGTGLGSTLVQRPVISELDKSTVFWTNAALGLLACLVGVAVSPVAADFYGTPEVEPLFAAASGVFFLSSLSSVQANLLIREMDFRMLELRSTAATLVGAAAAILVAADGGGPWALIVQQLAFYAVSLTLLTVASKWRPRLIYSRKSLRELRSFGANVSGTLLMTQMTQNADNVLIGRVLGASSLGLYTFGYSLIMMPVSRIASPLVQVLYPVFARVQAERARLTSLYLRSLRIMLAITLPAMLGLVVVAPDMIAVVFGRRWHNAVPIVQILSAVGLTFGVSALNATLLQAIDRTGLLLRYSVVLFAASLISFIVGLNWGIVGVAGCFAAVNLFVQPVYLHLTARAVGIGLGACLSALSGVLQATALSIGTALITRGLLLSSGTSAGLRLAAVIVAAAIVYTGALLWRAPDVVGEARRLRPRQGAPEPAGAAVV